MFEILEADIVVFQETKIQRKDLRDDMVLVPGWDCYFSLPRVKKGYSGVVVYTRNETCAPIRAEEGLTGVLSPPNTTVSFRDLPEDQQIGGYPTIEQLSQLELDAATLDSEGRCVILEFPAFVLLGLYCPANRDESRHSFRQNFLDLMDARVRNLISMGKRVVVTGDLNISPTEIDQAPAAEAIRKGTLTEDDFVSTNVRRLFNQLLFEGKVVGQRDEGRELPVVHDLCRAFHPERKGMYTCWEQRINARPGNYGSRIDYVLCSADMRDWIYDANIQEGLMGSDHCPVYATIKDDVMIDGKHVSICDIMNPPGVFVDGRRQQQYTQKLILPISGRLIPEFDKRRSIKDMFSRKASATATKQSNATSQPSSFPREESIPGNGDSSGTETTLPMKPSSSQDSQGPTRKRTQRNEPVPPIKRSKSTPTQTQSTLGGQKTLQGFFKPKDSTNEQLKEISSARPDISTGRAGEAPPSKLEDDQIAGSDPDSADKSQSTEIISSQGNEMVVDPVASKEDWSKLFSKKPPPRCEGHQEPCISLTTKKPGVNCGRTFWICPRPLGPSGNKEKGTHWRCSTFIWASDWNTRRE
ncbi:Endonuclease/exonuclease/phosphatase [Aspergillus ambiguus]|uniref:DNA-(apurinic or apyrimidinic site) lyase APN2 n=1 Tax=Aspergillus ambiguus TaxID=176160 RepID=UPI003CCE03D5